MLKTLIFILLIFISQGGNGQDFDVKVLKEADSLKELILSSRVEDRVDLLNRIAGIYAPYNFDSSVYYSSQAIRLSTQYAYPQGTGLARLYTGNAYYYNMDFKNALISYLSAQPVLEEEKMYDKLGELFLMLGHINFFIRRSDKTFYCYRKALSYYQLARDKTSSAKIYESLSVSMDILGFEPKDSALLYGQKLLAYSRQTHDQYSEAFALVIIGQIYEGEKNIVAKKELGLLYNDSALVLSLKYKYDDLISIIYINIAGHYDRSSPLFEYTGNLTLSRQYYNKAFSYAWKIRSSYLQAIIFYYLAEIDIEERKFDQAEDNLDRCEARLNDFFREDWKKSRLTRLDYSFSKIVDYFLSQRTKNDMYNARYKLALARGEFGKAIEYLNLYYQTRDTINAVQQGQQFELLMTESEAERTDQKLRALAQENELNRLKLSQSRLIFAGIAASVIIISLFLLLFFQRKRLKAEQKSISMEQRLLRAQMNPHFLFNSLASIQNYIINEKTDQASIYLSRFSQLVRNILDNSVEEYVPLEKEIDTVRNYLELQKVRYTGKFDFRVDVDEAIDEENTMIPPMLAQPFIENSIEHGIKHKTSKGQIDIRFRLEDSLIRFEVEDDGVGREKAQEIEMKQGTRHKSMATSITSDRLMSINKKLKRKIRMEIIDLKDGSGKGCGTRVTFGIPVVVK